MLGAFFHGYIITQLPAGYLTEKFGGKWVFGLGNGLGSLFTILGPWMAYLGQGYFIANRILVGMCGVRLTDSSWQKGVVRQPYLL